ncbi:preprotein translocase subunit YajC [Alteriqipengyuania flavescens]|uniref:preprotein translocase subunit YajC n=1 Tax=Alteriqipengyuania flavescens TaxID=3053610 RepID=UPI0025B62177|nr:preprotein translocase subunit YajC [Alteriqipengyuania flavescens]WJY18466.1 preprotein translocase subunit YajC [Alteriqipengyuania flavescens]WJY24407.1 preprotein translocase subunit YajC [Alteriqipengyuania flavescens]
MRFTTTALLAIAAALVPSAQAMAQEREESREYRGESEASTQRIEVDPYIEVNQILFAELDPGNDVVTYTSVAAGIDTYIDGRNTDASVSLRYERRIGYDDNGVDGDTISGIARASTAIVPRNVFVEAGALATRTSIEGNGALSDSFGVLDDRSTQIYSAYAGPSLQGRVGDFQTEASYRFGYTKVEQQDVVTANPAIEPIDVFDESTVHAAQARIASRPGEALPVGVGVGSSFVQEDISNLDQRVRDFRVRGDVTVPVSSTVAVVGGIGYEDVEISSRDAVRDPETDAPLLGPDGRFVTDDGAPRTIAYEADGLIWDVGVMWRPSRRTAAQAYVGRRYGSTSYWGSLSYQPNTRTSLNVGVYDQVQGFGNQLTSTLADLPTNFRANRDPLTGDIFGCVGGTEGATCLSPALASVRSGTFRSRGVGATYARNLSRSSWGLGLGYDNREYIGAEGTVLAVADGVVDENYWASAFYNTQIDRRSSFNLNGYANLFQSGFADDSELVNIGSTASYYRTLAAGLSASAAVGIDGVLRDDELLEDLWTARAALGLRYTF